jgi:ABC-2 type transport system permease protein
MTRTLALFRFSFGELLGGRFRRLLIVLLLVVVSLLLPAMLNTDADPSDFMLGLFSNVVLPIALPVVSLVFSTAALGAELRDGTITNLVLKPLSRASILLVEYLSALLATLVVLLPSLVAAQLLAANGLGLAALLKGMLLGTIVAAAAYCALGLALSLWASRALLIGLVYAVVWEGAVVGSAPAASSLSVRGYAEGVLDAILRGSGGPTLGARLGPVSATVLALVVTVAALALAIRRLTRMDFR